MRAKRAEKKIGTVVRRIVAFCAMHILGNLPPEKKFPQFSLLLFPQLFPGGIRIHLSTEWTLLLSVTEF